MKSFTVEDIEHLGVLSRMSLTDEEKHKLIPQLNSIVEFIDVLNKLPTDGVAPTLQGTEIENISRKDISVTEDTKWWHAEEILAQFPDSEGPYLRVPSIIKK